MAAYRRVYDSHHLQADAMNRDQSSNLRSVIEYGLPLLFMLRVVRSLVFDRTVHFLVQSS